LLVDPSLAFYPAFLYVAVGMTNSVWVQHVEPGSRRSGEQCVCFNITGSVSRGPPGVPPEWDVFDAKGRFLGVLMMPRDFARMTFRCDNIYGVWRDELVVQYVVRLLTVGDLGGGAT